MRYHIRSLLVLLLAVIISLLHGLKRPRDYKNEWEPIVLEATAKVNMSLYANGRGGIRIIPRKVKDKDVYKEISYCNPKMWEHSEYYDGGVKDPIYRFCVRLHEKHHSRNWRLLESKSKYKCVPDPKDTGGGKWAKRDWLCIEKYPRYTYLPPHGVDRERDCTQFTEQSNFLAWYTYKNPPEWCHYNWYERRQTCWCLPGYYRDGPKDAYFKPRECPKDGPIFIMPQIVEHHYTTPAPTTVEPTLAPREGDYEFTVGAMLRRNAIFTALLVLSIILYLGLKGSGSRRGRSD